jgi:hypothetical protein
MALSANRTDFDAHQDDRGIRATPEVKNASVIYRGALCSCDTDTGACKPFDGTESDKLLGWHVEETKTGDTTASPKPRASLITGPFRWPRCPIAAGLAGTVADNGKRVWATDDGTYTCQDPGGTGAEVGYVDNYINGDTDNADVIMYFRGGYVDTLSPLPTPTPSPTPTPTPTPT